MDRQQTGEFVAALFERRGTAFHAVDDGDHAEHFHAERLDALEEAERVRTDKGAVSYVNKPVRPPTLAHFAAKVGVARGTLWEWAQKYADFGEAYEIANTISEAVLVEMGAMGGWNQRMSEFLLKNNHGYTDKAEVKTTGTIQLVIDEQDARHFDEPS